MSKRCWQILAFEEKTHVRANAWCFQSKQPSPLGRAKIITKNIQTNEDPNHPFFLSNQHHSRLLTSKRKPCKSFFSPNQLAKHHKTEENKDPKQQAKRCKQHFPNFPPNIESRLLWPPKALPSARGVLGRVKNDAQKECQ